MRRPKESCDRTFVQTPRDWAARTGHNSEGKSFHPPAKTYYTTNYHVHEHQHQPHPQSIHPIRRTSPRHQVRRA